MMRVISNLKMYKKLLLSPLVAITFLSILGAVSFLGLNDQKNVIRDIFENRFQIYQESTRIMSNIKSVHANIYQVLNLSSIDSDAKVIDELGKQQLESIKETLGLVKSVMARNLTAEEKQYYQSVLQQLTDYRAAAARTIDMASADYNLATTMMRPAVEKFKVLNQNLHGLMDLENRLSREKYDFSMRSFSNTLAIFIVVFVTAILLSLLTSILMTRFLLGMIRKMNRVVKMIAEGDLSQSLEIQAKDEIGQLAQSVNVMRMKIEQAVGKSMFISRSLSESASEQASALEETSASLNQTASMTKQNAKNTMEANQLMNESSKATEQASASMGDLTKSMKDIADASIQAQKIVKSIDEIAFQTNLLALNAAVEAARAGEAGAGFAVVAGEVRNLAIRATEAAKGTSSLIEDIINKVKSGENLVTITNRVFHDVRDTSKKVVDLVGKIAVASKEQSEGIDQINLAVNEMNGATQRNASLSEELSSAMSIFKASDGGEYASSGREHMSTSSELTIP